VTEFFIRFAEQSHRNLPKFCTSRVWGGGVCSIFNYRLTTNIARKTTLSNLSKTIFRM